MKRNGASFAGYPSADETKKYFISEGITNRRLLGRKADWDWNGAYKILAGFKEKLKSKSPDRPLRGREKNLKKLEYSLMSSLVNDVRTFFQEKS